VRPAAIGVRAEVRLFGVRPTAIGVQTEAQVRGARGYAGAYRLRAC
jgi:hypothetical protein